jgi:hypothetical protein
MDTTPKNQLKESVIYDGKEKVRAFIESEK